MPEPFDMYTFVYQHLSACEDDGEAVLLLWSRREEASLDSALKNFMSELRHMYRGHRYLRYMVATILERYLEAPEVEMFDEIDSLRQQIFDFDDMNREDRNPHRHTWNAHHWDETSMLLCPSFVEFFVQKATWSELRQYINPFLRIHDIEEIKPDAEA